MGPFAGVDYNLTSTPTHVLWALGKPMPVDFIPLSGIKNWASEHFLTHASEYNCKMWWACAVRIFLKLRGALYQITLQASDTIYIYSVTLWRNPRTFWSKKCAKYFQNKSVVHASTIAYSPHHLCLHNMLQVLHQRSVPRSIHHG
jgi:hypothetical protein